MCLMKKNTQNFVHHSVPLKSPSMSLLSPCLQVPGVAEIICGKECEKNLRHMYCIYTLCMDIYIHTYIYTIYQIVVIRAEKCFSHLRRRPILYLYHSTPADRTETSR